MQTGFEIVEEQYPLLAQEAMRFGLFQRLDYMLHIPVTMMNSDNEFYQQVKQYLRKHKKEIRKNPYLTRRIKPIFFCSERRRSWYARCIGHYGKTRFKRRTCVEKKNKRFFS